VTLPISNIVGHWNVIQSTDNDSLLSSLKTSHVDVVKRLSHYEEGEPIYNYNYRDGLPYGGRKSVRIEFNTIEEILIGVTAHEACHIYQFQNTLDISEAQCEWFAASQLELFRNNNYELMKKALPFEV
jgi:hypothetical protein